VAPETPDRRQRVTRFGWLRLSSSQDLALPGEWLTAIHHPGGVPKQVALRQNLLIEIDRHDLWYVTETAAASSGAPLFNDSWQVVGMHRAGIPARDQDGAILTVDGEPWRESVDETRIVWRAGVGTRTATVLEALLAVHDGHPLVVELRAESGVDAAEAIVVPLGSGGERGKPSEPPNGDVTPAASHAETESTGSTEPQLNGKSRHDSPVLEADALTVTVPLRITVRGGNGSGRRPAVGVDLS
jgi:hypothetical protein